MLDSMDIYRGIREGIEAEFENIPVQTKDIKNPQPPCFYIKSVSDTTTQTAENYTTTQYLFQVVYFSEEETQEDLVKIKERLRNLFIKPVKVTAYEDNNDINYLEINSFDFTLDEDNYFLNCSLTLELTQRITQPRYSSEEENTELMEQIDIRMEEHQ